VGRLLWGVEICDVVAIKVEQAVQPLL